MYAHELENQKITAITPDFHCKRVIEREIADWSGVK